MKYKNMPLPGDYFESYNESQFINQKNDLSWYDTYVKEFNEWKKEDYLNRKNKHPMVLTDLFPKYFE